MALLRQKVSVLPPRLEGLAALATNLSWSWNRDARDLLRTIDPPMWRETRHNPIAMLREVSPSRLERLAHDADFLARYDRVMNWIASDQQHDRTWFGRRYPNLMTKPIAYFCAEFGLHNSVPIYSCGLGILAGDHCKTASDLGLPFVGIGLSYMKGYFDQRLRADGWQEDSDDHVDPALTPLLEVRGRQGEGYLAVVETFTSGHIAMRLAHLPGAEAVFRRGIVARERGQVFEALGLPLHLDIGEYSEAIAAEVASAAREHAGASHALAVLIDLDEGADRMDLGGTIWVAVGREGDTVVRRARILGGREWIRLGAVEMGLDCLRRYLQGLPVIERTDFERR